MQHPSALIAQKRPDLMKEPCTIVWDVTWNDLMTLEVTHGPEEPSHLPPSRLIIHLRDWSQDSRLFDSKEIARVVKCHPGTKQAAEIQGAIQHAYNLYGPDRQTLTAQVRFTRSRLLVYKPLIPLRQLVSRILCRLLSEPFRSSACVMCDCRIFDQRRFGSLTRVLGLLQHLEQLLDCLQVLLHLLQCP